MSEFHGEKLPNPFTGIECSDGAKWGVSDFYDEDREALLRALRSGEAFDTGWYSVKKEIESGRVYRPVAAPAGMRIHVEASCSDDFDTEGHGEGTVEIIPSEDAETLLDRICEALDRAREEAHSDRRDNDTVALWSILKNGEWIETYLEDVGGCGSKEPPGDYYSRWGFQGNTVIPKPIRRKIQRGIASKGSTFTVGEYTVRRCDEREED